MVLRMFGSRAANLRADRLNAEQINLGSGFTNFAHHRGHAAGTTFALNCFLTTATTREARCLKNLPVSGSGQSYLTMPDASLPFITFGSKCYVIEERLVSPLCL